MTTVYQISSNLLVAKDLVVGWTVAKNETPGQFRPLSTLDILDLKTLLNHRFHTPASFNQVAEEFFQALKNELQSKELEASSLKAMKLGQELKKEKAEHAAALNKLQEEKTRLQDKVNFVSNLFSEGKASYQPDGRFSLSMNYIKFVFNEGGSVQTDDTFTSQPQSTKNAVRDFPGFNEAVEDTMKRYW